jgi:hypothetical protein
MSFRQKINGPMCFVEFEDVGFAANAIQSLYGHSLVSVGPLVVVVVCKSLTTVERPGQRRHPTVVFQELARSTRYRTPYRNQRITLWRDRTYRRLSWYDTKQLWRSFGTAQQPGLRSSATWSRAIRPSRSQHRPDPHKLPAAALAVGSERSTIHILIA